ncbi:MAG: response regulator [Mycobacteriales bacterium]
MTTVLICDDTRPILEGLCQSVASLPGVDRVEPAASGEELLARFAEVLPDLVLVDVEMPGLDGLETTRRLLRAHPSARVVMLTAAGDRDRVVAGIAGGARGYLAKSATRAELGTAIATALAQQPAPAVSATEQTPMLTERELQVLAGMAAGRSNGQIGRALYLSEDTVKTHARRLFRKLGVKDRAQAVALGFRRGLVR